MDKDIDVLRSALENKRAKVFKLNKKIQRLKYMSYTRFYGANKELLAENKALKSELRALKNVYYALTGLEWRSK